MFSLMIRVKLKKLFSVEFNARQYVIRLFGIKLSFKRHSNSDRFFDHIPPADTVLLIEPNFNSHYECLPGLCSYIRSLGYDVELLVTNPSTAASAMSRMRGNKIKMWSVTDTAFLHLMECGDFSKYHSLIFNSKRIYFLRNGIDDDGTDVTEIMKCIEGKHPTLYLQHHLEYADEKNKNNTICLANPGNLPQLQNKIVNAHDFGEVKITPKNKCITRFITVGGLIRKRRNPAVLVNAVKTLHDRGIRNFQIIVISRENGLKVIPPELRKYFRILVNVSYALLYDAMEKADYFLPLLDPQVSEHKRYMKYGTSGSFQLIYGFQKPCLIHRKFADIYGFTGKDSFIYDTNDTLSEQMMSAISCTDADYAEKQENLKYTAQQIYQISRNNSAALLSPEQL